MHIIDLFEKRERAIYQLFLLLRSKEKEITIRDASQCLELSRSTLLRYIETFTEEAVANGLGFTFQISNEDIQMEREAGLSLQDFIAYLCRSSIKYQILLYLFEKNEFSIPKLSQELLISEATLNRQLASLNKMLQSFEISIRSGRLKGSELQIRYFYYQLFWQTSSNVHWQADRIFRQQKKYVPIFERFYQSPFNPRQSNQMALWLMIVYKRMRLKDLDFQDCYRLIAPYKQHKFYLHLRNLFLTLSQQFSASFQEGDTMSVFAFLFSQGILEAHQLEQLLGFGGPIMEATTWGFKQIKIFLQTDLPVEEGALYHLNQVFSHLYFFTSHIENDLKTLNEYDHRLQEVAQTILTRVNKEIYGRNKDTYLLHHTVSLLELFTYVMQVEPTIVQIGFSSSYPSVISYPILQTLQEELEANRSITIEYFDETKTYDLIISYDYPLESENIFYLYGSPSPQDLQQLKKMISVLHKEKLEQSTRLIEKSYFLIDRR